MSPIDPGTVIVRDPDMIAADMDGDLVMMSIERGEYFGIGGVGTLVWELLEQPTTVDRLAAAVCEEFEVDAATCSKDLLGFVNELLTLGLVRIC
jgi:hypothetical protein